jgi:hypothetical protein
LEYTVNYQKQELEQSCNFCNAYCLQDDGQSFCTTDCSNSICNNCESLCNDYNRYTTAVANGNALIVDAANYIQCQQVSAADDADDAANEEQADDDGSNIVYYIGPYCKTSGSSSSTKSTLSGITIGLFSDANCYEPVHDVNITEVLGGVELSYHLLKHTSITSTSTSSSSGTTNPMLCLSCIEGTNNNNQNDVNDADDVNEMCENVYQLSAKCESTTGLTGGFIQMNQHKNDENQEEVDSSYNQVENEFMACTFIQSLLYNSYTETGTINFRVPQDIIIRQVTSQQRNAFLFVFTMIGVFIGAIFFYHKKIQEVQQAAITTDTPSMSRKSLLIRRGEIS